MRKTSFFKIFFVLAAILSAGGFALARAEAATYSFSASATEVHMGEEVAVDVVLDPEGQSINTVSATIKLPANLSYAGMDDSASIVGLWVDAPRFDADKGTFSFSGIIPGGFSGLIDPFSANDSRKSDGTVIRLLFKASIVGTGTFSYGSAGAYLNDALGTQASVSTKTLSLVIDTLPSAPAPVASGDTDPPLPFTPILERDFLLYNGSYVVIFNTKDKGSGMDHYEIKEGNGPWTVATSPYVLKDQSVSGDIVIKALDRAGNAQYETIPALQHLELWVAAFAAGLLALFLIMLLVRRYRRRKAA